MFSDASVDYFIDEEKSLIWKLFSRIFKDIIFERCL